MSRPSTAAPCPPDAPSGSCRDEPHSSVTEISGSSGGEPLESEARLARSARLGEVSSEGSRAELWQDGRALAGALHEVSNALTVVLGWLDALGESDDPAKMRAALEVAREHARRGRSLARRAIGAEDELGSEARGATGLARFAVMSVRPRALAQQVFVELEGSIEPDVAVADEGPALQVLTNLLLNAIDFSPPGGAVRVGVEKGAATVTFTVSDEGPGVPEEKRATLFADPVSTRRGGAGIGLTHSRRLACERGGDLRLVPSERGACFELVWPRASTTGLRPQRSEGASRALVGARILVVEDDAAIASLLELSLEAKGAEVLLATSPDVLGQMLSGRPVIDAALLDLSPVKEGLTAWLDDIRRHAPGAPLLLVSGHPNGVPEEAAGRFAAWVRKPFEMGELLDTLGSLLAQRAAQGCP